MILLSYAIFALGLAGLAAAITWAMARWAVLVDVPNARSSHATPTPRGGGLGILIAFAIGVVALRAGAASEILHQAAFSGLIAGAMIMGLAGLADDIRSLSFVVKLGAQVAAAMLAIVSGLVIETLDIPLVGPVSLGAWGYPLTLLWLVGVTNAFNFMDGLDGLAGGTAVIAAASLCLVAGMLGLAVVSVTALLLAATSAGFLALNFPPARIFMGDVGSQFLGFAFAALGVLLASSDSTGTLVLIVPLLLFHFLFDTVFTAVRRMLHGENPTAAHRTHLYQLLNRSGLSHRQVALLHYLLVVLQGLGAVWLVGATPALRWLVFAPFLLLETGYACVALRLFKRVNKSAAL